MTWVFLALTVIVLCLGAYAFVLWRQVLKQREETKRLNKELENQEQERHQYLLDSIETLARVIVQEQGNLTECAIRLKVLLENVYPNQCPKDEYRAIYELAWATAHMPILEQRNSYTRSEISAFDNEREVLESKMKADVIEAAKALLKHDFSS